MFVRAFVGDQEKEITKCSNLYLESIVEVRPRQACVLACVVLAETSEELVAPRVLEEACYRFCGTE